jgi:hypothetical protein
MTEIHKVKCDKCGKIANMVQTCSWSNSYQLPLFWRNIQKNWFVDANLCRKCISKFKKHSKEFFND